MEEQHFNISDYLDNVSDHTNHDELGIPEEVLNGITEDFIKSKKTYSRKRPKK